MIVEQNSIQSNNVCEKNVETQFTDDEACGQGINDRVTSSGEGRVTSDGECRVIV